MERLAVSGCNTVLKSHGVKISRISFFCCFVLFCDFRSPQWLVVAELTTVLAAARNGTAQVSLAPSI